MTRSGAHLASSTAAIHEQVSALCVADLFVERPMCDALAAINDLGEPRTAVMCPGSLPENQQDVHVTFGLVKGGDAGTLKLVATMINQPHPNSPSKTFLVGVCPCEEENYDALVPMLHTHLPQVEALLRDGVVVRGATRPVRLILGCDYAAQCNLVGHKGATATQSCLCSKRTRWPSKKKAVLDTLFGTLQDVTGPLHLRETMDFAHRMVIDGVTPLVRERRTPEHQCSVVRSPLLAVNPRQIVPIPLHGTQGTTHRFLRLSIEIFRGGRSATDGAADWRQAGAAFALELVKQLYEKARVRRTSYHGGLFIGRDCHTIGDSSAVFCDTLVGKVLEVHLATYKQAWLLWSSVGKTLNRACTIPAQEASQFRADTAAMVTLLEGSFPWLSVLPKLHILIFHAADFLDAFGSIRL